MPPAPTGGTPVAVVMSSAANGKLSEYDVVFQSITLTSQSGKTVTLLAAPRAAEFIHVNGTRQPLAAASIPPDVYTAATASVGRSALFGCISLQPTGLSLSLFQPGATPTVTVSLPSPITVTDAGMGLTLDMLVSQSATYSSCDAGSGTTTFTASPTFTLTSFALPDQTGLGNAKVMTLDAQVLAVDAAAGSFQLALASSPVNLTTSNTLSVSAGGATVWQGIANLGALTAGMFVDLDGAIQPDGSVLATRIEVTDASAVNVERGPLLLVNAATPVFDVYDLEGQGKGPFSGYSETYSFAGAAFRVSGQFTNLQSLPFTASFNGTNMVPGQDVYISSPAFLTVAPPNYNAAASTITLMPQTIDGTIANTSISGSFTVYTVTLAAYDLFPTLAAQPGQTTLLSNPGQVEVYVDSSTQMFNTIPLATGATLRFYGLVFNDSGTLRMDCAQIDDGVAE